MLTVQYYLHYFITQIRDQHQTAVKAATPYETATIISKYIQAPIITFP